MCEADKATVRKGRKVLAIIFFALVALEVSYQQGKADGAEQAALEQVAFGVVTH
jgi:hypothetical protein